MKKEYAFIAAIAVLIAGLGYGYYEYSNLQKEYALTKSDLETQIANKTEENKQLAEKLAVEESKNSLFEGQIREIAGTVGTLDKLSKTDKELLQKYSKVYFLNEHYVPSDLATVTAKYIFENRKDQYVHAKVLPYLSELLKAAENADKPLRVISTYRSFGDQSSLKGSYLVTYGTGANKFSADQGFSEHQLGTTLDFTTPELGDGFTAFKNAAVYDWLLKNAYKYGFVLSYPEGNAYYQFEPWHWRFVGKKLALRLHNESEHFYDLEQRIIDSYLINIFD